MRLFDSLAAQLRRPSFSFLFGSVFLAVTLITSLLFITLGSIALDRFFCYYVDKLHAETHKMLVMQIEMQFDKGRGFNAAYLAELGESAKALGDFFTVRQLDGTTVFSNENQAAPIRPTSTPEWSFRFMIRADSQATCRPGTLKIICPPTMRRRFTTLHSH